VIFILVLLKLHQSASLAAAVWVHKSNQRQAFGCLLVIGGGGWRIRSPHINFLHRPCPLTRQRLYDYIKGYYSAKVAACIAGLVGLFTICWDKSKEKKRERDLELYEQNLRKNGQSSTIPQTSTLPTPAFQLEHCLTVALVGSQTDETDQTEPQEGTGVREQSHRRELG
jgi:hypothetical protein